MLGSLIGSRSSSTASNSSAASKQGSPKLCPLCRKQAEGAAGDRDAAAAAKHCPHKHTHFSETVSVVYIPKHSEYSNRSVPHTAVNS